MTVNEIKDMINSTISENGERGITGQALNLALNAIADALANAGGGGLETIYLYEETMTPEQQAANAAVFAKAKAAYEAGQPLPNVRVCMPPVFMGGAGVSGYQIAPMVSYIAPDTEAATAMGVYGLLVGVQSGEAPTVINEDGSVTEMQ